LFETPNVYRASIVDTSYMRKMYVSYRPTHKTPSAVWTFRPIDGVAAIAVGDNFERNRPSCPQYTEWRNTSQNAVQWDVSDAEVAYLTDHVIDGRVLIPATYYLMLAWRQLATMNGCAYQQTPVCFDDVRIHRATLLPSTGQLVFIFY